MKCDPPAIYRYNQSYSATISSNTCARCKSGEAIKGNGWYRRENIARRFQINPGRTKAAILQKAARA